jgi:predicted nucleic acid-binding protein
VQYVDTSALLKRYVAEPDSAEAARLLHADADWVTAAHTEVEVRRNLARRLAAVPAELARARRTFAADWARTAVVALDRTTLRAAADLAETTGARTLDALHLAAAHRVGAPSIRMLTYDARQAQTARSLGWSVVGA